MGSPSFISKGWISAIPESFWLRQTTGRNDPLFRKLCILVPFRLLVAV